MLPNAACGESNEVSPDEEEEELIYKILGSRDDEHSSLLLSCFPGIYSLYY